MHGGREAVCSHVAQTNGIGFVFEFGYGADGSENFLLDDLHVFGDVGEDGRLDVVALLAVTFTANFNFGAFFLSDFDVTV